jgi:cell division protein FtsB
MHSHTAKMLTTILDYYLELAIDMSEMNDISLDTAVIELQLAKQYVQLAVELGQQDKDYIASLTKQKHDMEKQIAELTARIEMLESAID